MTEGKAPKSTQESRRILVVDDELDIQTYLRAALEDEGYETCGTAPDQPILETMAEQRPDLVLLDIMMPRRSGISIYKTLRSSERFRHVPVALMSGMVSAKDFLSNGFRDLVQDESLPFPDGFVEKPVRLDTLMQMVKHLLDEGN